MWNRYFTYRTVWVTFQRASTKTQNLQIHILLYHGIDAMRRQTQTWKQLLLILKRENPTHNYHQSWKRRYDYFIIGTKLYKEIVMFNAIGQHVVLRSMIWYIPFNRKSTLILRNSIAQMESIHFKNRQSLRKRRHHRANDFYAFWIIHFCNRVERGSSSSDCNSRES